jgi:hypothetical protein
MTARHDPIRRPVVKLTSQLTRGDRIRIDGLGGFAVVHAQPFGSKALIRLAWENPSGTARPTAGSPPDPANSPPRAGHRAHAGALPLPPGRRQPS